MQERSVLLSKCFGGGFAAEVNASGSWLKSALCFKDLTAVMVMMLIDHCLKDTGFKIQASAAVRIGGRLFWTRPRRMRNSCNVAALLISLFAVCIMYIVQCGRWWNWSTQQLQRCCCGDEDRASDGEYRARRSTSTWLWTLCSLLERCPAIFFLSVSLLSGPVDTFTQNNMWIAFIDNRWCSREKPIASNNQQEALLSQKWSNTKFVYLFRPSTISVM